MARIRDPEWWQQYLPVLRREFSDLTMDILIAGGDTGAEAIRAGSVLVNWDVFNEDALTWLDMYLGGGAVSGLTQEGAYAWAWALNDATRRGVAREIDRWVRNGAALPELEHRLGGYFDERRAHRVAVTEVTRIFASGNVMAWKASGVVNGKRWRTAVDENVCPICSKLNGKLVDLDKGWEFNEEMLAADPALKRVLGAPLTLVVPPAHVMCRCWLQPVVFDALSDEEQTAGTFNPKPIGGAGVAPSTGRLSPVGRPVSQGINVPKTSKNRAMYERMVNTIDRVHGDGNLPGLTIMTRKLRPGHLGNYHVRTKAGKGPRIDITSDLQGKTRSLELTLVHEIGHYLDHAGIPSKTMMASWEDGITKVWQDAVSDSRAVRKLIDQWDRPHLYGVEVDGFVLYPSRGHTAYLTSPAEVWARAYSQYVAVRSGDTALLAAVAAERDDPLYGARQWDDDDFEPIAKAFDSLFEVLGWLKRL